VLASVELDNQAPLTANKVDIVSADRLLPDEFEAAELPAAKACSQRELCRGEGAPQHSRTLGALFTLAPQRLGPSGSPLTPTLSPQAGRRS